MQTLYQILAIAGAVFIVWWLYQSIQRQPEVFSRDKLSRSFMTMGLLALALIGFVAMLVMLVRTH